MTKRTKHIIWFACVVIPALFVLWIIFNNESGARKNVSINTIPYKLEARPESGSFNIVNNTLSLTALKGSDLFTEADGVSTIDNAPRVLFQPKGDFIFSAKVTADFKSDYDGGALIVYTGPATWAKLLFEYSKFGKHIVSSTVTKSEGDDAYHTASENNYMYLKIARHKNMFVFYTSDDGAHWNYVRSFDLKTTHPIKIGFSVQSPTGEKFTSTFSDIHFKHGKFSDFWHGE